MLQLQLKNLVPKLSKKAIFFIKLSFFCAGIHAVIITVFFLFPDEKKVLFLSSHNNQTPIIMVPFLKSIQTSAPSLIEKPSPMLTQRIQEKKVTEKKLPSKIEKIEPKKNVSKKTIQSSINQKEKKLPAIGKKLSEKKQKPVTKKEKPQEPKNVEIPKKIETAKRQEVIPQPEKKIDDKLEHVVCVGREDFELLTLSNALKQDIMKQWKRPATIASQSHCYIRVKISKHGNKEVVIEQPSHSLALDISARNFVMQYNFPKETWGKEIIITF